MKLRLKPLSYFHLPSLYPDTLTHPFVILGVSLRAPNQPEMHPKLPYFPLFMLKVVSIRLSLSKIAFKPLCHFHLPSLYPNTLILPSLTQGVPLRSPN